MDDDPELAAIRARRLAEMQSQVKPFVFWNCCIFRIIGSLTQYHYQPYQLVLAITRQ